MIAISGIVLIALTVQWAGAEQSFSCDFERDTCGFTNEEGLTAVWERRELKLGGQKRFVMNLEMNGTETQRSRMMTPYFEVEDNIPGCFSFEYYVSGNGLKVFSVEQERDYGIVPVFLRNPSTSGWQKPKFNVDVDESTRFFFTAVVDPSLGETTVAVTNMVLKLAKC